ncbi:hypothetical protein Q1M65_07280 (plasmid) [Sinorhizobium meliloti]|nr:hypothetical protein Q1M65_07280 [Sinorhizobium meliloti]
MTAETHGTDFDDWVVSIYRDVGSFTMLFVLLRINDTSVDLLRSAYLHVVGDELRWPDMVRLFPRRRRRLVGRRLLPGWPRRPSGGRGGEVEARFAGFQTQRGSFPDQGGDLFNADGLRLTIEEIKPQ